MASLWCARFFHFTPSLSAFCIVCIFSAALRALSFSLSQSQSKKWLETALYFQSSFNGILSVNRMESHGIQQNLITNFCGKRLNQLRWTFTRVATLNLFYLRAWLWCRIKSRRTHYKPNYKLNEWIYFSRSIIVVIFIVLVFVCVLGSMSIAIFWCLCAYFYRRWYVCMCVFGKFNDVNGVLLILFRRLPPFS